MFQRCIALTFIPTDPERQRHRELLDTCSAHHTAGDPSMSLHSRRKNGDSPAVNDSLMPPRPFIRKWTPPHATLASSCFWSGNGTGHELIELAACFKQTVQNLLRSPAGWNLMRGHSESSAAVLAMFWGGTGAGANCVI